MLWPSREDFLALGEGGSRAPVIRDLLADLETPLSAYWKLAHDETFSFLLESVTGGESLGRYSILGVRPRLVLRTKGDRVRRITSKGESRETLSEGQDPLDLLAKEIIPSQTAPGLPKFFGGAVTVLGYDLVRFFEKLPLQTNDDLEADDLSAMLVDSIVVFDHAKNWIRIVVNAEITRDGYDAALAEIERIVARLKHPRPVLAEKRLEAQPVTSNFAQADFEAAVERVREYIAAGDGIQMVLSQRFQTKGDADPIAMYRALRSLNPSPYMFLLRFGEFEIIGASPEILVSLEDGEAVVRPIAGTRPRGATEEEDLAMEQDLLADGKERAEHLMLVDLGRNDLGRICESGTIHVKHLMEVERYSHVMHIVSHVTGSVQPGMGPMEVIRATFPAGTVSGAPKVRAMEIIEELEPTRRGLYAGAVGYIGCNGNMDLSIAIRTIYRKGGVAYVQAGAGIVYDSDPTREFEETQNKAKACLRAIELARQGLES